jgi:hypothetical protein
MAKQTINIGTAPNDGTGTPLRTAFDYCNLNFTELYTAVGPSGNNIVVPGNATITGDLTVDTNSLKVDTANNRVGILTSTPGFPLHVNGTDSNNVLFNGVSKGIRFSASASTSSISGVDNTGSLSYQPLTIEASTLNFALSGSTAMTLNSTGLAVGTTAQYARFTATGSNSTGIANIQNSPFASNANTNLSCYIGHDGTANRPFIQAATGNAGSAFDLLIQPYGGNVGVGVTPSAWGGAFKALQISRAGLRGSTATSGLSFNAYFDGTDFKYIAAGLNALDYFQNSGKHVWQIAGVAANANDPITFTEAMTLDASGNLLVGKTASSTTVAGSQVQPDGTFSAVKTDANPGLFYNTTTAISGTIALFRSNGVTVGSISQDGTNTAYNNSSDYRLKESVQPLTGGLDRVNALKPSIYKWKTNGKVGEGFLAHELAEVVPFAVTGEKDAVTKDGEIEPQQVDLSKVVPILVAAIKELSAEVNALKNA